MILLGNDFAYDGYASTAYQYIDTLIELITSLYGNNDPTRTILPSSSRLRGLIDREKYKLFAFYSTPSKFLKEKNYNSNNNNHELQETQYQPILGKGHFIPYSDNLFNDWTGFYGTRPYLKEKIR